MYDEIAVIVTYFALLRDRARGRVRAGGSDLGEVPGWVLVAAISAAMAIAVGAILYTKFRAKATGIDTTTP